MLGSASEADDAVQSDRSLDLPAARVVLINPAGSEAQVSQPVLAAAFYETEMLNTSSASHRL
jgi:hypothetical protein